MAITNVQRTFEGERSDASGADLIYLVNTNSLTHESWHIQSADDGTNAIPAYGVNLAGTPWFLINKIAERKPTRERPFLWKVTCQFAVPNAGQIGEPGTKWAVDVAVRGLPYEEPVHKDKDGKPIQNSLGESYATPLTVTKYDEEITISYTTDVVDWTNIAALRGTINQNTVTLNLDGYARIWGAKSTKLSDASYSRFVGPDGNHYWRINLVFVYRSSQTATVINGATVNPWTHLLPNMGFLFLDASGNKQRIKDDSGDYVSTPQFLDSSSHKQTVGATVALNGFNTDSFGDFTALPIPDTGI